MGQARQGRSCPLLPEPCMPRPLRHRSLAPDVLGKIRSAINKASPNRCAASNCGCLQPGTTRTKKKKKNAKTEKQTPAD